MCTPSLKRNGTTGDVEDYIAFVEANGQYIRKDLLEEAEKRGAELKAHEGSIYLNSSLEDRIALAREAYEKSWQHLAKALGVKSSHYYYLENYKVFSKIAFGLANLDMEAGDHRKAGQKFESVISMKSFRKAVRRLVDWGFSGRIDRNMAYTLAIAYLGQGRALAYSDDQANAAEALRKFKIVRILLKGLLNLSSAKRLYVESLIAEANANILLLGNYKKAIWRVLEGQKVYGHGKDMKDLPKEDQILLIRLFNAEASAQARLGEQKLADALLNRSVGILADIKDNFQHGDNLRWTKVNKETGQKIIDLRNGIAPLNILAHARVNLERRKFDDINQDWSNSYDFKLGYFMPENKN